MEDFFKNNPKTLGLLVDIKCHRGKLRTTLSEEGAKLLSNINFGFSVEFNKLVSDFIDKKISDIYDENIVELYRLYVKGEPGPFFKSKEKVYLYIGIKPDSSMSNMDLKIEKHLFTKEEANKVFSESMTLFTTFKELVKSVRPKGGTSTGTIPYIIPKFKKGKDLAKS